MNNVNNELLDRRIIIKKYINEEENNRIKEWEDVCIEEDEVNLKLELEYRAQVYKEYKKSPNDINEFLYYVNNKLIGYLGISSFGRNIAEINGMVHPRFRRQGIFSKLLSISLDECKKRNFNNILLLCDDKSKAANEFIKSIKSNYSFSECRMKCTNWSAQPSEKNIILKDAKNKDICEIENLNEIFFGLASSEQILPEDEEKNNIITYLIQLDNKIIGKIKVDKELTSAFISGFGIIPEFRNKGYGKAALTEVLNNLKKEDINTVGLDVEIRNKNALNLYKACGFKEQSIMNYYEVNI